MTHTRGPRAYEMNKASHIEGGCPRFDGPGIFADDCVYHPIADASCNHTCRAEWEVEANARLMAAAPDLLAALKLVRDWLSIEPVWKAIITLPDETFGKVIEAAISPRHQSERQ